MTTIEFLSDSAKLYQDTVLPVCKKYGLTYMEFGVLMFLYNNPQYNTAAQIVSMRHIPKSHVSISVKSLMEKGLLRGEKCKDKRAVRLSVTEFAEEIARSGKSAQKNFVDTLYGIRPLPLEPRCPHRGYALYICDQQYCKAYLQFAQLR